MSPDGFQLFKPPVPAEPTEIDSPQGATGAEHELILVRGVVEVSIQYEEGDTLVLPDTPAVANQPIPVAPSNVTSLFPHAPAASVADFDDGHLDKLVEQLREAA